MNWNQLDLFSEQQKSYTVSEITARIRSLLESEPALRNLWVEGEISNFSRASSGHIYFTLKDAGSQISGVIWRSQASRLDYIPRTGDKVVVHGYIGLYEQGGRYQLYVDTIQPAGQGALYQQFLDLKARLEAEGLFAPERKRQLPPYPHCIGVVTSPTAAAFRDVLNVLRRRYPLARVLLAPTLVQGDTAPPQIVNALTALDNRDDVDVIIVIRGGGSLEDLWAFNDERVARAIAATRHPVVSGVGHETDFTLADFAADVRAPTPSAAAEVVSPDLVDLRAVALQLQMRLDKVFNELVDSRRANLGQLTRALKHLSPAARLENARQRVDDLAARLDVVVNHQLAVSQQRQVNLLARLEALSPKGVLARGYAIVWDEESGHIVKSISQVEPGLSLKVMVEDGDFYAHVSDV